jgi:uncharacterized protein YeaO (DUF488 family)
VGAIRIARVYDSPSPKDGYRVLVDRIWPRGVRKDELPAQEWVKDVAPSTQLRKWFGHDPARFAEFARRYRDELAGDEQQAELDKLRRRARRGTVTLLTAARDPAVSHVAVLSEVLSERR